MDQQDKVGHFEMLIKALKGTMCVKNNTHSVRFALFEQFGVAPIHLAALSGSLPILKLLVQAGAEQKVENEVRMQEMIEIMEVKLGHLSSGATTQKHFI